MAHQSNGQGRIDTQTNDNPLGNRSRSWNFLYATLRFQWGAALIDLKAWKRVVEDIQTDDNPDLTAYIGHSSLTSMILPPLKSTTIASE